MVAPIHVPFAIGSDPSCYFIQSLISVMSCPAQATDCLDNLSASETECVLCTDRLWCKTVQNGAVGDGMVASGGWMRGSAWQRGYCWCSCCMRGSGTTQRLCLAALGAELSVNVHSDVEQTFQAKLLLCCDSLAHTHVVGLLTCIAPAVLLHTTDASCKCLNTKRHHMSSSMLAGAACEVSKAEATEEGSPAAASTGR